MGKATHGREGIRTFRDAILGRTRVWLRVCLPNPADATEHRCRLSITTSLCLPFGSSFFPQGVRSITYVRVTSRPTLGRVEPFHFSLPLYGLANTGYFGSHAISPNTFAKGS